MAELSPIDGDESDDKVYIPNKRKAPPWVVVHEVEFGAEIRDEFGMHEEDLYYYHKGAGPKLAQAVSQKYPEFDFDELFTANQHVIEKSGKDIKDGVRNGDIDHEAIIASMDIIARFATMTAEDDALPNGEHVDHIYQGWMDGGHEGLEREYFKHEASKISVAAALHRLRGGLIDAADHECCCDDCCDD